jgi:hypothetical protein
MSSGPRLRSMELWQTRKAKCLSIIGKALQFPRQRGPFPTSEIELNREFYFCLLTASRELYPDDEIAPVTECSNRFFCIADQSCAEQTANANAGLSTVATTANAVTIRKTVIDTLTFLESYSASKRSLLPHKMLRNYRLCNPHDPMARVVPPPVQQFQRVSPDFPPRLKHEFAPNPTPLSVRTGRGNRTILRRRCGQITRVGCSYHADVCVRGTSCCSSLA